MATTNRVSLGDMLVGIAGLEDMESWRAVNAALKSRMDQLQSQKKFELRPGDTVQFTSRERGIVRGSLVRHMQKNSIVRAESGERWRVATALLEPVIG